MMFVLRSVFWLALVSLFLPSVPQNAASGADAAATRAHHALAAAREDEQGFCTERPEVCLAGRTAMASFGDIAGLGFDWLGGLARIALDIDRIGVQFGQDGGPKGVSTLRAEDFEPDWRGPAA